MASEQRKALRDNLIKGIEEEIAAVPINVMIMGPTLNSKPLTIAAKLRKELLERCPEFGANVNPVAPEHKDLEAAARRKFGSNNYNLCRYEKALAKKCDLIIILPASPGSYVELGLFAMEASVCAKCLILFDENHKEGKSFINLGPRKSYSVRHAKIKNVNYKEKEKVLKIVRAIFEKIREVKVDETKFA